MQCILNWVVEHDILFGQFQQHGVVKELVDGDIFTEALWGGEGRGGKGRGEEEKGGGGQEEREGREGEGRGERGGEGRRREKRVKERKWRELPIDWTMDKQSVVSDQM